MPCSRVSEAVTMFLSKDNLLNSKNEYVQNCISRVTVEEDVYQIKSEKNMRSKRILKTPPGWKASKKITGDCGDYNHTYRER